MVFGFDDVADIGILGVAWLIFTNIFPEVAETILPYTAEFDTIFAEESAPIIGESISAEITQGSSIALIQDLLGEEGLETCVDIASGDYVNYENLPIGQQELDMAEKVLSTVSISDQVSPTYNQALLNSIGRVIQNVSKKIPTSSEGFIKLISDIVGPLINNSGNIATVGVAGYSAIDLGKNAINKIKSAFDRDENLPKDIQDMIMNKSPESQENKITENDNNDDEATDQVISILPQTIL